MRSQKVQQQSCSSGSHIKVNEMSLMFGSNKNLMILHFQDENFDIFLQKHVSVLVTMFDVHVT